MPGLGFRPLGYNEGGGVEGTNTNELYAAGAGGRMYGTQSSPPVKIMPTFQDLLNQDIDKQDREILRDLSNAPPATGGLHGTESDRLPNARSFSEKVFRDFNPGGVGINGGIGQLLGTPDGATGAILPNAIEKQFISIEDNPDEVKVQELYEFLARPDVQEALRNSQSEQIRERYKFYMRQFDNTGRVDTPTTPITPAMPATGAGPVGSTMDLTPLFNSAGGGIPLVGEQY